MRTLAAGDREERRVELQRGAAVVLPRADHGVEVTDQREGERHQLRHRPVEHGQQASLAPSVAKRAEGVD